MIKFFRHIRKSLIEKNQMGKYFKYAIGEILLVVIGILIALQINNWNENRKAIVKQNKLLNNLKIDFEARLLELKEMNSARKNGIVAIGQINAIIANAANRPHDSIMNEIMAKVINGYKFNEDFKMLDVLFSTGLINDIKNEALKRKLIEWPQEVEEMLEEQRMHNHLIDNYLKPLLSQYISIREIYEKFDFRKYSIPRSSIVTLKKNYDQLILDPIFENYLAEEEMLMRVNAIDTENLISSAEEIINFIESEL